MSHPEKSIPPLPAVVQVPQIDYEALIAAAFAADKKWAQGTNGCIAFKHGAEWFRDQVLAAAPEAPAQDWGVHTHRTFIGEGGIMFTGGRGAPDIPMSDVHAAPEAPALPAMAPLPEHERQLIEGVLRGAGGFYDMAGAPAMAKQAREAFEAFKRAVPEAPAQEHYEKLEREHLGDPDKRTGIYAAPKATALPAEVREALKEAREALGKVDTACRLIPEDLEGYLEPLSDALSDARAAIARLDALGGGK